MILGWRDLTGEKHVRMEVSDRSNETHPDHRKDNRALGCVLVPRRGVELISSYKGLRSLTLPKRSRILLGILGGNPSPSGPPVHRERWEGRFRKPTGNTR